MGKYVLIRAETLAWLLERHRSNQEFDAVPEEVALDLRIALPEVTYPVEEERLRAMGPILTVEEHEKLLLDELEELPRDVQSGQFWRLVLRVVHTTLRNEAEAVLRLLGMED